MKKLYLSILSILSIIPLLNAQLYPEDYDEVDFAFDSLYSYKYQQFLRSKDSIALVKLYEDLNEKILDASNTNELTISNSAIHTLPQSFNQLSELESLGFINCRQLDIQTVIEQVSVIPNLKSLSFINCGLYSLSENIAKLENLEYLSIKENKIVQLPEAIKSLKMLKHLNVSNNRLLNEDLLFQLLNDAPQISNLEANYCAIRKLPNLGLSKLNQLSLAGNLLQELNDMIRAESLDLSSNPYLNLEISIEQLAANGNLKSLNLAYNSFAELPSNVQKLNKLESLNLRGNELTSLPESIGLLTKLKVLKIDNPDSYVYSNQIKELPSSIGNLYDLDSLFLAGNQLAGLPASFANLKALRYLDLSWNSFESFPKSVLEISSLEHLNLAINHVREIPNEIEKLNQLRYFNCQGDFFVNYQLKIKELPESIGKLTSLEALILSDNVIEVLPESIGRCVRLKTLDLKDNLLSTLPNSFGNLSELSILNLKANELTVLPSSIENLQNLAELNLGFNFSLNSEQASQILSKLPDLYILDIRDAYFSEAAVNRLFSALPNTKIITSAEE